MNGRDIKKRPECTYSVIMPIYNEEDCLSEMIERVDAVLSTRGETHEIICVDDCSTDRTWEIIQRYHGEKSAVKGIRFVRNFGHQKAIFAGLKHCRGGIRCGLGC